MAKTEWERCTQAGAHGAMHARAQVKCFQKAVVYRERARQGWRRPGGAEELEEHTHKSNPRQIKSKPEMCISVDSCILASALILPPPTSPRLPPLLTHADEELSGAGS